MKPTPFNRKRVVIALLVFILFISPLLPLDRAGRIATVTADEDGQAQPAVTLTVTNLDDSGPGSLRQAIDDASPSDIIVFDTSLRGTITLTGGELVIDKNLIINGGGRITVSGNNNSRVFNVQAAAVTIDGLTITNGNATTDPDNSMGGGILVTGNLTLGQSRIINNRATSGGGIAIIGIGSALIFNSTISDNNATAGSGGGLIDITNDSSIAIINSTISGNTATDDGGGLQFDSPSPFTDSIASSTISNNTAGNNGGGLSNDAGQIAVTNSTISGNNANRGGGFLNMELADIRYTTITLNNASDIGGGLLEDVSITNLSGTIVAQNIAPAAPDISGAVSSQGHNLIGNNSGASITAMTGDQIGTAGAPILPMLTSLQDNGGGTLTHIPISGSPAINAGSLTAPPNDQRGLFRSRGGVPDIGSTEFFIRRPTNLEITNLFLAFNSIGVTARLTSADDGNPIPGRTISFVLGFGSVSAVTDINGVATFSEVTGGGIIISGTSASFQGDAEFEPSSASRRLMYSGQGLGPQGDGCEFLIFNADESYAANGGSGSFNVRTFPQDCDWTAVSNDPWIQITSGSAGTGDGVVSYTVAANTDPAPRTGTITAAGLTFTVLQGAAFTDVPESHPFYTFIGKLSARSVTLGCDTGLYCPDLTVTRQQMAAFIIRALGDFDPPEPEMQRFTDVPPENPFYRFIDQMAIRQITLGCAENLYCPLDNVNRQQMAAFLIRALGEPNPPVPFVQRFTDVEVTSFFARFIDRLAVRRITLGCTADMYCPENAVTRGQMAAFLVRAFNL